MTAPRKPNRQSGPALGSPPADLSGFPSASLDRFQGAYRAFRTPKEPGWYSSSGEGRFDLKPPHGTLYVADDVGTAVRERLGEVAVRSQSVPRSVVEDMAVACLSFERRNCASLAYSGIVRWGVTRELETMVPYELPQTWANAFFTAGFEGIQWLGADLDFEGACAEAGIAIVDSPKRAKLDVIAPPVG